MNVFKPIGEKCPDCNNGYLVERVNNKTKNTFLGCSEWPDCKYTKNGGSNPSPGDYGTADDYNDGDYSDRAWFCSNIDPDYWDALESWDDD